MKTENIHPKLRTFVNAFMLKNKYPFEMHPTGRYTECRDTNGELNSYNDGVKFIDPHHREEVAGTIRIEDGGVFLVMGREIIAPRRKDYIAQRTKKTQQESNVLKLMLRMIKPFTLEQIASSKSTKIHTHLRTWRTELHEKVTAPIFNLGQSHRAVIAEMQNLKNLGVPLVTAEFRKLMEDTLAYHEEHEYRMNVKVTRSFVTYREEGIHVHNTELSPHLPNALYANFNELPEDIRSKVAFLKMIKDGEEIPEVGLRVDANNFWVLNMPARVAKGNV